MLKVGPHTKSGGGGGGGGQFASGPIRKVGGGGGGGASPLQVRYTKSGVGAFRFGSDTFVWHTENISTCTYLRVRARE